MGRLGAVAAGGGLRSRLSAQRAGSGWVWVGQERAGQQERRLGSGGSWGCRPRKCLLSTCPGSYAGPGTRAAGSGLTSGVERLSLQTKDFPGSDAAGFMNEGEPPDSETWGFFSSLVPFL